MMGIRLRNEIARQSLSDLGSEDHAEAENPVHSRPFSTDREPVGSVENLHFAERVGSLPTVSKNR